MVENHLGALLSANNFFRFHWIVWGNPNFLVINHMLAGIWVLAAFTAALAKTAQ